MCTNVNRKKEEAPSRYIRDYWDQHVADSRIQFQTWGSQADPIAPHPVYGSYPEDYLAYLVNLIAQQAILRVVKGTWLTSIRICVGMCLVAPLLLQYSYIDEVK
jgi:hypothetical protein